MVGGHDAAAVAESHTAVLWMTGDRVYKRKKPVALGFLDFSTLAARWQACTREVELNRRLAPDVYLGLGELQEPGRPAEPLVVMRRMPAERRLAMLAAAGRDLEVPLRQLARLLAGFHAAAERSPEIDAAATRDAIATLWRAGHDQLTDCASAILDPAALDRLDELASRYLAGRERLFAARIADGRICAGHGDLLADDVFCLDDGPRVLDCIEFDDRLRHVDILADVAFLAMDLERLHAPSAAARLLAAYAEYAGETWPASLAHFYLAQRAQVRAKVAGLRVEQGQAAEASTARALVDLADRHLADGSVRLVLIGGTPGTGKTTLGADLGRRMGWAHLRSDAVRKELAGMAANQPAPAAFGTGLYSPAATHATYSTLLARARTALELGESVILDASWSHPETRAAARGVAAATVTDLVELRCATPGPVALRRVLARQARGGDASDASAEVADRMRAEFAPWPSATVIDTDGPPQQAVDSALHQVGGAQRTTSVPSQLEPD